MYPEIIPLVPWDALPVLIGERAVCQAVTAEAQVGWHPRLELDHKIWHVEDGYGEEAGVAGRCLGEI